MNGITLCFEDCLDALISGIPYEHLFQLGVVEGPTRLYNVRLEQSRCVWQMQNLYGK